MPAAADEEEAAAGEAAADEGADAEAASAAEAAAAETAGEAAAAAAATKADAANGADAAAGGAGGGFRAMAQPSLTRSRMVTSSCFHTGASQSEAASTTTAALSGDSPGTLPTTEAKVRWKSATLMYGEHVTVELSLTGLAPADAHARPTGTPLIAYSLPTAAAVSAVSSASAASSGIGV